MIEKILAEIKRRYSDNLKAEEMSRAGIFGAVAKEDYDLISFIESLMIDSNCGEFATIKIPDSIARTPRASGIELIAHERLRQIEEEGFDAMHDWYHMPDELATAAAIYAMPERRRSKRYLLSKWPWEIECYKPTPNDRVRELVKAGALIAAEIDRIQTQDRFEKYMKKQSHGNC